MIKTIVKIEKDGRPVLFFPEYPANPGNIMYYVHEGQHGEASVHLLRLLKNPEYEHDHDVNKLLREYRALGSIKCELVQVRRDSAKMREARWAR